LKHELRKDGNVSFRLDPVLSACLNRSLNQDVQVLAQREASFGHSSLEASRQAGNENTEHWLGEGFHLFRANYQHAAIASVGAFLP
jgi:hypothetical protein